LLLISYGLKIEVMVTSWSLWDTIRGARNTIYSNSTNAEGVESGLSAFGTNGFTVGSALGFNKLADAYVSWNWKAGGTAVSNTEGQ
jgi:hypothetical protein